MFTIGQIKSAHSKVKTGADFPRYIQEIKKLGLTRYEYYLKNGIIIYYDQQGQELVAKPIPEATYD